MALMEMCWWNSIGENCLVECKLWLGVGGSVLKIGISSLLMVELSWLIGVGKTI